MRLFPVDIKYLKYENTKQNLAPLFYVKIKVIKTAITIWVLFHLY